MKELSFLGKFAQGWVRQNEGRMGFNRGFGGFLLLVSVFHFITLSFTFAVTNLLLSMLFFISSGFVEFICYEREREREKGLNRAHR
ncbi:MAG: hypothetical protein ISR85_07160 [Kiritimatiellales bacterium]|nr:hypothetical protein [Kiritimatiellota bacterium]MBL7012685.1 hypothetical protein [Kiritimatiellales bacterium]